MTDSKLYYTPPTDLMFEEMKEACIKVWGQYADSPGGYMQGKIDRIKGIGNIEDNFMYMLAMFDMDNQRKVIEQLSDGTKTAVRMRMVAGGNNDYYIEQIGL